MKIGYKFFYKIILTTLFLFIIKTVIFNEKKECLIPQKSEQSVLKAPLIFIGGFEKSGAGLLRVILDAHESISCGPDVKILGNMFNNWNSILNYKIVSKEIKSSGISYDTIETALGLFIYHIMNNHIRKSPRLCAKDSNLIKYMNSLHKIFPNAKFVYIVRDGRGAAYSFLNAYRIFNRSEYLKTLSQWEEYNRGVNSMCKNIGTKFCKMIKYENLVTKTEKVLRDLMKFLDLKWTNELLNHHKFIGKKIKLSMLDWRSFQFIKPINNKSLDSWKNKVPNIDTNIIQQNFTMLNILGY